VDARKIKIVVVAGLLVGALAFLVSMSFSQNMVYAMTVGEYLDDEKMTAHGVRISGVLAPGTHNTEQTPDGVAHRFKVYERTNEAQAVSVLFVGPVPDSFQDNAEVIVEGKMGSDGVFAASTVTPKCASKYEAGDSYAAAEGELPYGMPEVAKEKLRQAQSRPD
jgi:cytochrome c-type biogenesis protein CcmE